jgi:hypothetical protein
MQDQILPRSDTSLSAGVSYSQSVQSVRHRPRVLSVLPVFRGLGVLCALCVCVLCAPGCGYALAGRGSFLPDYIHTIGVPAFLNRTNVFNLETQVTQKVRSEFIGRGKFKILPESTGVDALLIGEIASASLVPVTFSTQQIASRYALTLTARIQLRDVRENKTLWENPSLVFRQEYEAQSGTGPATAEAFFGQDANAIDRISTDFARTIVSSILEAF